MLRPSKPESTAILRVDDEAQEVRCERSIDLEVEFPFVSVVVSFHNEGAFLRRCLQALLNQSYPRDRYEIILVNDGSVDGTQETISDLLLNPKTTIRIFSQSDRGPAAGRNLGVANATGTILVFTDPDCIPDSAWLMEHAKHYAAREVGGVEGRVETDWKELLYPVRVSPAGFRYVTCNISYRKEVLEEIGLFDENFRWREDTDLAYRVIGAGWKIESERSAVVHHPVKKLTKRALAVHGLKHRFDVALYRKHPDIVGKDFRLRKLGPVALSREFFFCAAALLSVFFLWLAFSVSIFLSLPLLIMLVAWAILQRHRMLRRKARASLIWMVAFIVLMEIGRVWGSLKFRRFML
jgi:glycosyltransferase involved in cell wall biosynthesis